jgi:hypothetical protein
MALDPVTGAEDAVSSIANLIGRFFPDKTEVEKAQLAGVLSIVQGQLAANTAEAAQPGLHFRDGAGWVCVFAFGLMTLKPVLEWGSVLVGHPITLPAIDTTVAMTMLSGLLGLGGMHVYQQTNGK